MSSEHDPTSREMIRIPDDAAQDRDVDPDIYRRRLRNILRRRRESLSMTQSKAANAMSWSISKLIRIEAGSVTISVNDLRALLAYYQIADPEEVGRLVEMAKRSRARSWLTAYKGIASDVFIAFLGYEYAAIRSYSVQPTLVPGILQTEEYAIEVLNVIRGSKDPRRIDALVDLQMARQERIFSRTDGVELHYLLDESVVRRIVGDRMVMKRQISHLIDMSQRGNVSIRIIPFEVGLYRSIRVPFVVLEFSQPEDENILYLEYPQGESLIREDAPFEDDSKMSPPTIPSTYLQFFAELQGLTSEAQTIEILYSALAALDLGVGPARELRSNDSPPAAEVTVDIYLDTDDLTAAAKVFAAADSLTRLLGYVGPFDEQMSLGSIRRRAKAIAKDVVTSEELTRRLVKLERAVDLRYLDSIQADVDIKEAQAFRALIESLAEIPQACLRIGSLLVVKYLDGGAPKVLSRNLSQPELQALERFPEILKNPYNALDALAAAVASKDLGEAGLDGEAMRPDSGPS